jgi:dTDP-glucose 4,6-dehydratase
MAEIKNILITGGAGFIASHMIIHLVKTYPQYLIVNLDKMGYASSERLVDEIQDSPNYKFVKGNILSDDLVMLVLKEYKIDTVMHFAGETHVDNSFGHSLSFTKNNVLGTHTLAECCRQYGVKRFIHISTDEVYGESAYDASSGAVEHSSLLRPTNPYSASKAAAEHVILSYFKSWKFPVIITRSNNIFGPHQFPEKVIPKWICLLQAGQKCPVHGDGSHLRAFLYVEDVIRAYSLVLHKGEIGQVYNISSNIELSNLDLAKYMVKLFDRDPMDAIQFVEDRAVNDERYHIDDKKVRSLGWSPQVSFDEGMQRTMSWYKDRDLTQIWENYNPTFLAAHPHLPKTEI